MTVDEFRQKLEELDLTGNEELRISAMGGLGGYGKPIAGLSLGFDWDHGDVLIIPKHALRLEDKP